MKKIYKKYFIFTFFFIYILSSCNIENGGSIEITGRIIDSLNNPIKNATIEVRQGTKSTGWYAHSNIINTTCDDAGIYRTRFTLIKNQPSDNISLSLKIPIINNGYQSDNFIREDEIKSNAVSSHHAYTHDFVIAPITRFIFKIRNISPYDSTDRISFGITSPWYASGEYIGKGQYTYNGLTLGNRYNKIAWYFSKNNIITNYTDSIFCKANETITIPIDY